MRGLLAALFLAAIGGCASGGFPDQKPPPIDPDHVLDAVPKAEPIVAAGNKSPYRVNGVTYQVMASAEGYREEGIASWYGLKFHGRNTSNGERFNVYSATAAHKTLPIPSYVRVTNQENQRSMIVRVNDRGPFHPSRIIDLSYGAALKLGFADKGTARVKLEAISLAGSDDRRREESAAGYRNLQLGAFTSEAKARQVAEQARSVLSAPLAITPVDTTHGRLYRLRAGPFSTKSDLELGQTALAAAGLPRGLPLP